MGIFATRTKLGILSLTGLILTALLLTACGGDGSSTGANDTDSLTQEQVETIVRAEIAAAERDEDPQADADSGLTEAQVQQMIQDAVSGLATSEPPMAAPGVTAEQAQQIAEYTVATIPAKTSPADYTQFVVQSAIARYETEGLEDTLAHYNRASSIDGQWYVFIADEDGTLIGHFNTHILGENLNGPLGTDAGGYNFGPEMLAAGAEGAWVSYVYNNPATAAMGQDHLGTVQLKHAWVVRHDGLLFGSGWYVAADEYTQDFVQRAIDMYHTEGREAAIAHYTSKESVFGEWYLFMAEEGRIIAHPDPEKLGATLDEVLDTDGVRATGAGTWVSTEGVNPATGRTQGKHVWLVNHDGVTFASGWHHDEE